MKINRTIRFFLASWVLLAACSREQPPALSQTTVQRAVQPVALELSADSVNPRELIKTVRLEITVSDTSATAAEIETLILDMGGYVSGSNATRVSGQLLQQLTLRVPSSRLNDAIRAIKERALEVLHESLETRDVTDQLFDLEARLRTLLATETELQELLSQSRARNHEVEGIMSIYRELTEIRTEIERIQARQKNLSDRVEFSEITVSLSTAVSAQPLATQGWQPLQTVRGSVRILLTSLQFLGDALITILVVAVPIAAILFLPIALVKRVLKRRRSR